MASNNPVSRCGRPLSPLATGIFFRGDAMGASLCRLFVTIWVLLAIAVTALIVVPMLVSTLLLVLM